MKIIYVFTFLFLLSACYKGKTVDLIIHNANVKVLNDQMETSEAIAIADGKIIEVGPERQILNKYTASNIINAQKKDVLPGFHDAHGHLMSLARQRLNVDLRGTQSEYEMIARLEKHHQKHKQQVLVGRGWDQSLWGEEKMPNNDLLNERFKDLPVAVTRIDGHAMLINQAMMKHLGITDSTEVKGGKFIKSGGKLTGILLDHALDLVNKNLPKPTNAALKKELIQIQEDLIATGITHVHEAGLSAEDRDLLIEMAENNELLIHVYGMLFPSKKNMQFAKENGHFKVKNLSIRSFKIIADGALGSHGACMIQPYSDEPENYGMLLKTPSEIKAVFEEAKHSNYQVNSHCIGDSANRTVLRFIDTLLSSTPDHRWRIEHAQILHPEDFELLSHSGALPSVQPTHAVSDQRWAEDRIGKKRLNNGAYAYNSLQKSSGMVLFGTDFPIENYDPFATIHAAVERKNIENEPLKGFISDEAISFEKTLKAMTLWPAYGCFEEANVGSIEKGKTANLVIFDQPVKSHSNFLPNYSWITIINGEITFDMR